jgi:FkbM family methyltransferase
MRAPLPLLRAISRLPRGGFPIVRWLARGDVQVPTAVGPMWCDLRESVCYPLLRSGTYEHAVDEFKWLESAVGPGDLVLDIGANIGFTALLFARTGARVIAFEPSPRAFRLLQKNVGDKVELQHLALSDVAGVLTFAEHDRLDCSAVAEFGFEVNATTLDALDMRPSFIKLDVEGHEAAVLRGGTETLRRGPRIFFEALDSAALKENEAVLRAANPAYRISRIGNDCNYLAEAVGGSETGAPAAARA